MPNLSELDLDVSEEDIPDEPGPAVLDRTPVVGTVRRSNGLPVARDEVAENLSG